MSNRALEVNENKYKQLAELQNKLAQPIYIRAVITKQYHPSEIGADSRFATGCILVEAESMDSSSDYDLSDIKIPVNIDLLDVQNRFGNTLEGLQCLIMIPNGHPEGARVVNIIAPLYSWEETESDVVVNKNFMAKQNGLNAVLT